MSRTSPPSRSGITGLLFVFSITALLVGFGFDLGAGARLRFWIGDQPAAATAVGVAAVLFTILAAQVARVLLGGRRQKDEAADASTHT